MTPGELQNKLAEKLAELIKRNKELLSSQVEEIAKEEDEQYKKAKREHELKELNQRYDLREKYAHRVFVLICVWLSVVVAGVFLDALYCVPLRIPENVLITLISTTTASILGYFIWVLKYLFPS